MKSGQTQEVSGPTQDVPPPPSPSVSPTVEGLVQLDPVLVHEVAVVLAVPEAGVPVELADTRVEAAD